MIDEIKTDINGRKYLTINQAKPGLMIECDDDFTCIRENDSKIIQSDDDGSLYITCKEGKHYLDGQLQNEIYIGIYPKH